MEPETLKNYSTKLQKLRKISYSPEQTEHISLLLKVYGEFVKEYTGIKNASALSGDSKAYARELVALVDSIPQELKPEFETCRKSILDKINNAPSWGCMAD